MSDQIIDIIDVAMPGPTGDVTPEALQVLSDTEGVRDQAITARNESRSARDEAEGWRDEAEQWASLSEPMQDATMASIAANENSLFREVEDARVVNSEQVGRIVAVFEDDPAPPLQDGDLLVRYGALGAQVFTEFESQTGGEQPSNLTEEWGGRVVVVEDVPSGATYLKAARIDVGITLQTEDTINSDPYKHSAEVLFRYWNVDETRNGPLIFFGFEQDISGTRTAAYGIQPVLRPGTSLIRPQVYLRLAPNDSNVWIPPAVDEVVNPDGGWLMFRGRVEGTTVFAKVWPDGTPEPTEWQLTYTDPRFADIERRIGVGRVSFQGQQFLDWIAWATGSHKAVKP